MKRERRTGNFRPWGIALMLNAAPFLGVALAVFLAETKVVPNPTTAYETSPSPRVLPSPTLEVGNPSLRVILADEALRVHPGSHRPSPR